MSNIGKGARQLWYEKNCEKDQGEGFDGKTLLKFMLGDIVEHVILFLAEHSGHAVTHKQAEVHRGPIKGHIDADIDGVTVDIKSASPFAFLKFKKHTLAEDDAFGYIEQMAGYCKARDTDGAFLAFEKVSGELCYDLHTKEELAVYDVDKRIEYVVEAVASPDAPERCYPDEEYGASGNRALCTTCGYCPFKRRCWADANGGLGLRTFLYSNKPVYMTQVTREPKVQEVTF